MRFPRRVPRLRPPRRLQPGEEATLVEHLDELRSRLIIGLLALVVCLVVTYIFRGHILDWLNNPLPKKIAKPITFSPAEPFVTSFMVALFASFLLSLPVLLWQIWSFFAPAFEVHAQRIVAVFTAFATVLLAAGVTFAYFVVLPAAIRFLTSFDSSHYAIQIRARDYYGFAVTVFLAVGLVFELPIFILALVRLGVLSSRTLRKKRKIGLFIMACIAVALPGVDPVTTTFEMLPLMALFEGSIWLSVFFERRWSRQAAVRQAAFEAGDF